MNLVIVLSVADCDNVTTTQNTSGKEIQTMEKYNEMNNQELEKVSGGAVAADIREGIGLREIIAMRKENDLNQLAMIRRKLRRPDLKQAIPNLVGSPIEISASETNALQ